ncbi:hypothetical protein TRAPUB_8696 [Trametes pubescens]|uniref:Uncharacterized protein n=1 Tax=Trametes pubescens TaxID=154538 RepID=A0A1M2W4G7_TRAPU|nr:hypothetical protein TRAPUB_8696 [Trametes pubescens]
MQPTAGSSSYTSHDPPPRSDLLWDRIPSLKILKPPKGPFSQQVDERCLTFCSQSITGRIHGHDPWCRSLCVRRVFLHEVTRVLATHAHAHPSSSPVPVHYPLPPEGQRYSGWLHALVGGPSTDPAADGYGVLGDRDEPRTWKAGWYLWWSRSRWAAQERFDQMRRSLEAQAEWEHLKARRNDEWAHGGAVYDEHRIAEDANRIDDLGNMPPFPDVSHESILLPLPELHPFASLEKVLGPTRTLLVFLQQGVRDGVQQELMRRMYEKARSDEPLKLFRMCCGLIWSNMGFGDDDDDEKKP